MENRARITRAGNVSGTLASHCPDAPATYYFLFTNFGPNSLNFTFQIEKSMFPSPYIPFPPRYTFFFWRNLQGAAILQQQMNQVMHFLHQEMGILFFSFLSFLFSLYFLFLGQQMDFFHFAPKWNIFLNKIHILGSQQPLILSILISSLLSFLCFFFVFLVSKMKQQDFFILVSKMKQKDFFFNKIDILGSL